MTINYKIKLTDSQKEAYDLITKGSHKYVTLLWSRQAGKSTLMKILVIQWLFSGKTLIGYVCRNAKLAKKFFKEITGYLPKQYIKSSNASDLTIETTFGSNLTFFSAESGDGIRGFTFNYLICDEMAFFNDGADLWNDVLFSTVKVKGRKVIFVSTPCGKQNIFHTMYLRGSSPNFEKYTSLKKTIYEDGLITEEEIENLKNDIPPIAFQQEYLCEFLDSALTYFTGFEKCFCDYKYNFYEKQWVGIDLSSVGDDDTIVTFINESAQTIQYKITGTLDQKYRKIAELINGVPNIQKVLIEVNGVGAPMINEIKKLVKNKQIIEEWLTTNDTKTEICSALAIEVSKEEIYFNTDNQLLYNQFSIFIYRFTKTGKLQLSAEGSKHDDAVLSLAIALKSKQSGQTAGQYNLQFGRRKKR